MVSLTPNRAIELLATMGATVDSPCHSFDSQARVARFTALMAAGQWRDEASLMIVDCTGQLADGFHRCKAVARSGVAIPVEMHTADWRFPA
jgi:hypothetical protein